MSGEKPTHVAWKVAAGAVLIASLGLGVWWIAGGSEAPGAPEEAGAGAGFQAFGDQGAADEPGGEAAAMEATAGEEEAHRAEIVDPDAATLGGSSDEDAGEAAGSARHGAAPEQPDVSQWSDPVNQKVLGKKEWMAKLPEAERRRIDQAFERERESPYPIDLQVRRRAIERVKTVVFGCHEQLLERAPQAKGRLSVAFDVSVDGQRARLQNVDLPVVVQFDDPDFEACILDGLDRITFAAQDEGVMRVEYPFLLD